MGKTGGVGRASRAAGESASGRGARFGDVRSLSGEEVAAVRAYQEASDPTGLASIEPVHRIINHYFRGRIDSLSEKNMGIAASLDRTIARTTLGRETTLFRGTNLQITPGTRPESLVGMTVSDAGFFSTTTRRSVAENFGGDAGRHAVIRIKAPAGTHGLPVFKVKTGGQFTGTHGEGEVLLPRGTTVRIIRAKLGQYGIINVDAEIVR